MKLLILASVLAAAVNAGPQGYGLPTPSGPGLIIDGAGISGGPGISLGGPGYPGGSCGPGQVRHVDGSCVTPVVTRNLYVYDAPEAPPIVGPPPQVPPPRVEHNILFIRTQDDVPALDPVVVPPPQQRNIVYVLSKRPELDHQVIHVPGPDQQTPEVFFVNYAEGDNPTLPTGEDLQSALSAAAHGDGEVLGGGGGIIGGGVGIGGGTGLLSGGVGIGGGTGLLSGGVGIGGGGGFVTSPPITIPSTLYRQP